MKYFIILILSSLFLLFKFCGFSKNIYFSSSRELNENIINVKNHGVRGDGISDDWASIQKLIDSLANNDGGILFFPEGRYIVKDKTLLLWGKNITILGEPKNKTIFEKQGSAGWWGELLTISGKASGGKYYGSFGKTDYNRFVIYDGVNEPSKNITINNIFFTTNSAEISSKANNVAIFNSNGVIIKNCVFSNAPQTNLAIVNNTLKSYNKWVIVSDCIFQDSGNHNVRVISYNQGKYLGNQVYIKNSIFKTVLNSDKSLELKDEKVHLWYRAGQGSDNISLTVENCKFDKTGKIRSTVNASNFKLKSSIVVNKVELLGHKNYLAGEIELINNIFFDEVFIANKNTLVFKNNSQNNKEYKRPKIFRVNNLKDK
ncbi:MAG: hypothetical protein JJE44_06090 [Flavobacteriaceae bacterium]|nr:hypothetical protein [Flavobacteriaceae bacterium]